MKLINILLLIFLVAACTQKESTEETVELTDDELKAKANELAKKFIITDGHIDLPYRLKGSNFDIGTEKEILIAQKTVILITKEL